MIARMISLVCVVALVAAPAWAQGGRSEEGTSGQYVGVVTGARVNVRAGPETGYEVTRLSSPAQVTVVGKVSGWLKILPPPDVFGVIAKQHVTPDATGKVGTLSAAEVYVRAGGPMRQTNFDSVLIRLNQGDKVEIVGEIGQFYKITPPQGSFFWISEQYVRPLTAGGAAAPRPPDVVRPEDTRPPVASTNPAESAGTRPPREPTRIRPPPLPTEAAPAPEQVPGLKEAEDAWKIEMAKKPEQRDYAGLLEKYKAVNLPPNHSMSAFVENKLRGLQNVLQFQKEMEEVNRLVDEARTKQEQYRKVQDEITVANTATRPVTRYAAQGVLSASDIFPGTGAVPKRWIVRDRQTLRVDAYVQSSNNAVDLNRSVGKHVGILGKSVYDQALGLDIVEAEKVVVLEESVELPGPPKPILRTDKPQPRLAPIPPGELPGTPKPAEKTPPLPVRPVTPPAPAPKTEPAPAAPAPKVDDGPILGEEPPVPPATPPVTPAPATQPAAVTPAAPAAPKAPPTQPASPPPAKPAPPAGLPLN